MPAFDPFGLHTFIQSLLAERGIGPEPDEAARDDPGPPEQDDIGIGRIGAWAGRASMRTPTAITRSIAFARSIGLGRLDVIVNDHSKARAPRAFDTYPRAEIVALADEANAAGMHVHLMTWIMPHPSYIAQAADVLRELVDDCGAHSVMLDAEEPWTLATQRMPYDKAAELVGDRFDGVRLGVTGIGYADADKLGPLARECDYLVPQCYSTSSSRLDPGTVVPKFAGRWRRVFGADREIVVGLAGYRQTGIAGYTPEAALRAAFAGAEADAEAREVVYWSLGQLRDTPTAARVVRSFTAR
jgi:hypothetical protein